MNEKREGRGKRGVRRKEGKGGGKEGSYNVSLPGRYCGVNSHISFIIIDIYTRTGACGTFHHTYEGAACAVDSWRSGCRWAFGGRMREGGSAEGGGKVGKKGLQATPVTLVKGSEGVFQRAGATQLREAV